MVLVEESISHGGMYVDGDIRWTVDALAIGESVTVTFDMVIPEGITDTNLENVAVAVFDKNMDGTPDDKMSSTKVVFEVVDAVPDTIPEPETDIVYPPQPDTTPETESPQTGEDGRLTLWFAMLFVSGGALLATFTRKKKA